MGNGNKAFKNIQLQVTEACVLISNDGTDLITLTLTDNTSFPMGYNTLVHIDTVQGNGVEWLKEVLGIDDPTIIDAQLGLIKQGSIKNG